MHVLHRPHTPRLISVSVTAAIVAIVVSFALIRGLGAIAQSSGNTIAPAAPSASALVSVPRPDAPQWVTNPFANPVSQMHSQLWLTARP
jgi:hypothetical protein